MPNAQLPRQRPDRAESAPCVVDRNVMSRGWVWLQLVVAWLPMWALFTALIVIAHGMSLSAAAFGALRMVAAGALLGVVVYKFVSRTPWPHPFRFGFVIAHVLAAAAYALP